MYFGILDVEHGFSAYAIAADGNVLLFDCGHSDTNSASTFLSNFGCKEIEQLFIMNYDEDHVSDLPNLRLLFPIKNLMCNKSTTSSDLFDMKYPVSPAMSSAIDMRNTYVVPAYARHEGIEVEVFCNSYPEFNDTNNLSLLVFLKMGSLSVVMPGDLEHKGWVELLKNHRVRYLLDGVTVFVASHHGRQNGYCKEVFDYCNPEVVVFSDGPIAHDTQRMAGIYGQHASGVTFNGESRYVLTTRNDGSIWWER